MNTHKIFKIILFALMVVSILGCSASGATSSEITSSNGFVCPEPSPRIEFESTSINIYTWTEYVPAHVIECFSLMYNIEVNVDFFSSNEELYSKVAMSEGINTYDVIHPSDYMIGVLMREGQLQALDKSKLPNLINLSQELISVYGASLDYIVPYQMGTQAIVYNSETVTTPPTAWADLWKPEYQGRIVSINDSRVVIGATLLTLGYDVNTTDESELEEAKQKLSELMPNIYEFDSDSPKDKLISGEAELGIVWNGEAFLAQQENPALQYVYPEEGSIIFYDGMGISTSAPHPDVAYAWLNYLLQGNINWLTLVDYPYTNPNQGALNYARENQPEIYEAYINSNITNTPVEEFMKGHEVIDLGAALLLYSEIWADVKK